MDSDADHDENKEVKMEIDIKNLLEVYSILYYNFFFFNIDTYGLCFVHCLL